MESCLMFNKTFINTKIVPFDIMTTSAFTLWLKQNKNDP